MLRHQLASTGKGYDFLTFRLAVDEALLGRDRSLIVDLDQIGFLDALVIRELIRALRRLRDRGGTLYVLANRPPVICALRATGLDRVFRAAQNENRCAEGIA